MRRYKIVAVGEKELIAGFRSVGLELIPVQSAPDVEPILRRLSLDPEVALILMTESIAQECLDAISRFREKSLIVLLVIPSHQGSSHIGMVEMRRSIERAVGTNLLGEREGEMGEGEGGRGE